MKKVIFHPQAEAEFDNAIGFYEEIQIGLGLELEQEIIRALSIIIEDPMRWPHYKFELRKFVLNRFPFRIDFKISGGLKGRYVVT